MTNNKYEYCHVVGRTDVGCKRPANEDNMGTAETINGLVSVVCDGMGGHVGGATASRIAVDTILEFLNNQYYDDPRICIGEAVDAANKAVLQQASRQPELTGMGSTCVVLLVRDGKVYLGHVGDSRIYLIRDRTIKQLTKDHSFVQMLVDRGDITPEQAEHHPRKNEITNALGIPDMKPATIMPDAIIPVAGDCFLLCSDGLSGMVSNKEIERIVSKQADLRAQERADLLVERAKEYGGLDNITVQLVEFSITPSQSIGKKKSMLKKSAYWGVPIGLLAIVAAVLFLFLKKEDIDRQTTIQVFNSIKFSPQTEVINISYGDNSTIVKLMESGTEKGSWSDNVLFTPDSLIIVEGDVDLKYDNRSLIFKDSFNASKLRFRLSNKERIIIIEVPVVKETEIKPLISPIVTNAVKTPNQQQPHTPSVNSQKPTNSDLESDVITTVADAANNSPIEYDGFIYIYEKGKKFFTFSGGEKGYCEMPDNNRVSINFPFTIIDTNINFDGVTKEGGDNTVSYVFGDVEPDGDIIINIQGKKEEEICRIKFTLIKR